MSLSTSLRICLLNMALLSATASMTRAAWMDDFDNGDPLTNSTPIGWVNSFIRPALGSMPNIAPTDTDASDNYSFLAEPGRLPSAVNLRTRHDGANPGQITLRTASPLPELNFFSGETSRLEIRDWNAGPMNNGNLGGGQSLTNAFGTLVASTAIARVSEGNDELWFRQDHSANTSISFFNRKNGTNANAPGTRTDFAGVTANTNVIPFLYDSLGNSIPLNTFIEGQLLMLNFDVLLNSTQATVKVWSNHPVNGRIYSSSLSWAHGMTEADWNAGTSGGYVAIQPYANLGATPVNIRGSDLSVGSIAAFVVPEPTSLVLLLCCGACIRVRQRNGERSK